MGAFLIRLVDQWEIQSPHVFAPDVGTSAALFAAAQNPGRLRSAIVGSSAASFPLQTREDYLTSYEDDRFAESSRYVRSYGTELPILGELLGRINTPVLVLQGDHDPYVPPANGRYLDERLPHSRYHELDSGHFFWEDANEEFAALASPWVDGQYRDLD
jgi:pimeloyl-ACP methyl ester carboxylesterase